MAHLNHPSVMDLSKRQSVTQGKEAYLQQLLFNAEEKEKEKFNPSTIEKDRLKKFSYLGEKYFKVLVDSINTYKDKEFKIPKTDDIFEKDDCIQGTYVDNQIVFFGAPYNTYCGAKDVEPVDIDHIAYLHKQKQREQNQKRRQLSYKNDINDNEYKMAINDSEFEQDEHSRLVNNDDQSDNEDTNVTLIDNIVNKIQQQALFKLLIGPYKNICIGLWFLIVLIFDILLIVFLSELNDATQAVDKSVCDEKQLLEVYDGTYLAIAVIGLIGLVLFCAVLYFGGMIMKKGISKWIVNGIVVIMIVAYVCMSIWQIAGMKKNINIGVNGLSQDNECNVGDNSQYVNDMHRLNDNIGIVTILKLVQCFVLVLLTLFVIWLRS
eukprot:464796_1